MISLAETGGIAKPGLQEYNPGAELWIAYCATFQAAIVHLQGPSREADSVNWTGGYQDALYLIRQEHRGHA